VQSSVAALASTTEVDITDTERDLQQSYGAYNFLTELEIRTVRVLSLPYNQGTYGHCAAWHGGHSAATDCVTGVVQQQFHTDLNSVLFACRFISWVGPAE
jgi:hypothetical protein